MKKAFSCFLAAAVAASCAARSIRVTAEPSVVAAAQGAPIVLEEWGVVLGADGSLSRWPYAKTVIAPSQRMSAVHDVEADVVRVGLASAATGSVAVAVWSPQELSWVNEATETNGVLLLSKPFRLPVGSVDRQMGALDVDARRMALLAGADLAATNRGGARIRVDWTPVGFSGGEALCPLPLDAPPAGRTIATACADLDGDGKYTPGEPYGATKSENGTYAGGLTLSWCSSDMLRIDLARACANNTFDGQASASDRGVRGNGNAFNISVPTLPGGMMPDDTETSVRVRVMLSSINGRGAYEGYYAYLDALDCRINVSSWPVMTEAELLACGKHVLGGGGYIVSIGTNLGLSSDNINRSSWRIVIGDGTTSSTVTNNNLATGFINVYESRRTPVLQIAPNSASAPVAGSPTFTWADTNLTGKVYPAFTLSVWSASTGGSRLYTTGVQPAPARSASGVYSWTAPIRGGVGSFATNVTYYWSVSMLDAKFPSEDTALRKPFRLAGE